MDLQQIIDRRTHVAVARVIDDAGNDRLLGYRGRIIGADTEHIGTPDDPLFDVRFASGHKDQFWGEELTLVPEDVEANYIAEGGTSWK